MLANLLSAASAIKMANSSPPRRARMSDSRKLSLNTFAASTRARFPSWWPNVSLIRFKPSRSTKAIEKGSPVRLASFTRCSASAKNPLRLYSPVRSSTRERLSKSAFDFASSCAFRASFSSTTLRAAISRSSSSLARMSSAVLSATSSSRRTRYSCSSLSTRLRSVISREIPIVPITFPLRSTNGNLVVRTQVSRPSVHVSFSSASMMGRPVRVMSCSSANACFACSSLNISKSVLLTASTGSLSPNLTASDRLMRTKRLLRSLK